MLLSACARREEPRGESYFSFIFFFLTPSTVTRYIKPLKKSGLDRLDGKRQNSFLLRSNICIKFARTFPRWKFERELCECLHSRELTLLLDSWEETGLSCAHVYDRGMTNRLSSTEARTLKGAFPASGSAGSALSSFS